MIRNKKGLSTVVTTLIILVVSVLLATVVTYYAINVTSTRVEEESLYITKVHLWYDVSSGTSKAAFLIINTGGRDVVIDKITVRGQECTWSSVYYNITTGSISEDLSWISGTPSSVTLDSTTYTLTAATSDLTLASGYTMIVYIVNPDSISVNDVGITVGITIFTSQAQYYKECNVESTS
ncbi:hypothetical protein DRO54_03225 [Candidatus Bathyarchaeota archaeon]|nr:MAG: hypothetical protein DRO54_03225 [Candidatus Bathyarchaeota archaeon]